MSAHIVIFCDWTNHESACAQRTMHYAETIEQARTDAVDRDGWQRTRHGRDLCPSHAGSRQ